MKKLIDIALFLLLVSAGLALAVGFILLLLNIFPDEQHGHGALDNAPVVRIGIGYERSHD